MIFFYFLIIVIIVHICCFLADRSAVSKRLFRFFSASASILIEDVEKQYDQLNKLNQTENTKVYMLSDVAQELLVMFKFRVTLLVPFLFFILLLLIHISKFPTSWKYIFSIILSICNFSYSFLENKQRGKVAGYYICYNTMQKMGLLLIWTISLIMTSSAFQILLTFRGEFLTNLKIAMFSYSVLLCSELLYDYLFALIYSKQNFSFQNLINRQEPVVLFLRPFVKDDDLIYFPFIAGPTILRFALFPLINFSEGLSRLINTSGFGILIGVANPNKKKWYKGTFFKTIIVDDYDNKDKWKKEIFYLLPKVNKIISLVGNTEGVSWELNLVEELGVKGKTMFLLPLHEGDDFPLITKLKLQFKIKDVQFPNEFYNNQFIGLSFDNNSPVWYMDYGRDFFSYYLSIMLGYIDIDNKFKARGNRNPDKLEEIIPTFYTISNDSDFQTIYRIIKDNKKLYRKWCKTENYESIINFWNVILRTDPLLFHNPYYHSSILYDGLIELGNSMEILKEYVELVKVLEERNSHFMPNEFQAKRSVEAQFQYLEDAYQYIYDDGVPLSLRVEILELLYQSAKYVAKVKDLIEIAYDLSTELMNQGKFREAISILKERLNLANETGNIKYQLETLERISCFYYCWLDVNSNPSEKKFYLCEIRKNLNRRYKIGKRIKDIVTIQDTLQKLRFIYYEYGSNKSVERIDLLIEIWNTKISETN